MKMKKIIIVGAGSLGKMTASILVDLGYVPSAVMFTDDMPVEHILDFTYLGKVDDVLRNEAYKDHDFCIAIANNNIRAKIAMKYNELSFPNIIHPSAVVSKYAQLGKGNIILPNVSIDPEAQIQDFVVINKNTSIGHNVTMRNFSQACPGCNLGGDIGKEAFLGLGTIVLPNIKVGNKTIVGAGSIVIRDLPASCTAVGSPAKPIKFHE